MDSLCNFFRISILLSGYRYLIEGVLRLIDIAKKFAYLVDIR